MSTAIAIPDQVITDDSRAGKLIPHHTAREMARIYREATAEIKQHMMGISEQSTLLSDTFNGPDADDGNYRDGFAFGFDFHGNRSGTNDDGVAEWIFKEYKKIAWKIMIHRLGLRNIMSLKKRAEFDRQLESGELPEICEETIVGLLSGLLEQAKDFAKEASREVFDILRPQGWASKYKTNDSFRIGKRVILPMRVERCYGGKTFRASYHHEQSLIAIDGVFHLLDGKGIMREHGGPLVSAIAASKDGKGETDFFVFKCFKNRNLHLQFKRLDLVKQLNLLAAGEAVLGKDTDK